MSETTPRICRRSLVRAVATLPVLAGLPVSMFAEVEPDRSPASMIEEIGAIVSNSNAKNLSAETHERVTASLVDNLATLTFTADAAKNDPYLSRIARRSGRRDALIIGTGKRAPMEDASGALSFLIHYSETDDSDFRAELRASPIVIGPALAIAQRFGASGDDLYAAIAAGYSVLGGLASPFGALQPYGLMSSGFWGAAASAAVTSRLMKLSPAQTASALSLALSAAGGTFQYFYDQTEEKRLILGRAARAGAESALLAAEGERGARHILEGSAGIYGLLSKLTDHQPDVSGVVDAVRRLDGPLFIYPKFYAASSSITPSLEALHPLLREGLTGDAVDFIALRADPILWAPVKAKLDVFERPSTLIGAKINYAYMVAFLITYGAADAATVSKANFSEERILRLAERVRFEPRKGLESHIVVGLKDGTVLETEVPNQRPGDPAPLAAAMREDKFRALTEPVIGQRSSASLWKLSRQGAGPQRAKDWIVQLDGLMRR